MVATSHMGLFKLKFILIKYNLKFSSIATLATFQSSIAILISECRHRASHDQIYQIVLVYKISAIFLHLFKWTISRILQSGSIVCLYIKLISPQDRITMALALRGHLFLLKVSYVNFVFRLACIFFPKNRITKIHKLSMFTSPGIQSNYYSYPIHSLERYQLHILFL